MGMGIARKKYECFWFWGLGGVLRPGHAPAVRAETTYAIYTNTAEQSSTDLTNTHRQPAPGEEGGVGRARVEGHLIVLLTGRLR